MNSYYILLTIALYFGILLTIARITGRKGGSNAAFFKGENKSPWYIVSVWNDRSFYFRGLLLFLFPEWFGVLI